MRKLKLFFACLLMAVLSIGQVWGTTYNLVTDASTLSSGDKILLVSPAGSVTASKVVYNYNAQAMTSSASGTRLGSSEVTISNNSISSTTAEEFTLSGSSSAWKIYSGTKYLTTAEKNKLSTTTEQNGLTFTIAIANTGIATITTTKDDFSTGTNKTGSLILQMNATTGGNPVTVSTYFALYSGNQKSVYIYKKESGGSGSSNPTISTNPASAKYGVGATATALSVSATVSEGGGTLHYAWKSNTTNSVEGASDAANATDASTYTPSTTSAGNMYYFCVVSDDNGSATSSIAEVKVMTPLTTMDEIFAAATAAGGTATDAAINFDDWQISGVKNSNAFLTDGTKGAVIYGSSGSGFAENNVLSGIVACKVQLYKQFAEITSLTSTITGLTVNEGSELTPVVKTIDQLSAVNTGALVTIQNLTYNGTNLSDGANTIITYNTFYSASLTSGKKYNITGVFQYYDGTKQILPRKAADVQLVQEKTLTSITLSGTYPTVFEQDDEFTHAGLTVTANYSDDSHDDVTASATFTGYDMSATGEQTVTVHYSENTTEVTTTYTINVSTPTPTGDFDEFTGDLVEGDYLIYYDGNLMLAGVTDSRLNYQADVVPVDGTISDPSKYAVWTLAKSGDYWTLYNAKTGMYAASTGAKNKAQLLEDGTDDMSLWTISEGYEIVNKKNTANEVNANLRYNSGYGFACYSTGTGGALSLYKKAAPSYSITATLTGCTADVNNPTKVPQALTEDVVLKYNLATGYVWPDAITVEVGGVALDASEFDYLWDTSVSPAELTIAQEKVTGNIEVTITADERTLDYITVKEAPTKTAYFVGDFFNPAGLEIQLNYTAGDPETVVYNDGTKDDFSFSPDLETALTADDDKVVITYAEKSVNQGITVTTPTPEEKKVVIIAEYDSKFYAMSNAVSSNACAAIEVTKDGANLVAASDEDKAAIQWLMTTTGNNVTFQNASDKYLSSVANDGALSLVDGPDNINWSVTEEGGKYLIAIGDARSILYRTSGIFKHYAKSNLTSNSTEYFKVTEFFEVAEGATNIVVVTPVVREFVVDPDEDVDFGTVDKDADNVAAKSFDVTLTNINNATVTLEGGNGAFSIDKSTLDENGGTITITPNTATAGNFSATITLSDDAHLATDKVINVTMRVVEPRDCDREDDFSTVGANSSYTTRNSTDGWNAVNTAVITGEDITYWMISGGTDEVGVITSPEFNYGIGKLSFDYKYTFSESNGVSFKVEIKQNDALVAGKSYTITNASAEQNTVYSETIENINVEGKFQIVITNLSPSNKTGHKDRFAIGNLCWKKYGEPVYEELRAGATSGKYYTVCLSKNVTDFRGGNFWNMSQRNGSSIAYLEEVTTDDLPLAKGTPYIFEVTGAKMEVVYEGAETNAAGKNGALVGTFATMDQDALNTAKANNANSDIYLLSNNSLVRVTGTNTDNNSLAAGRAYIVYDQLTEVSEAPHAPGKRVRAVPMQGQTATGVDALNASETPVKMIIDGQLYILRGEKMYDATGKLVK